MDTNYRLGRAGRRTNALTNNFYEENQSAITHERERNVVCSVDFSATIKKKTLTDHTNFFSVSLKDSPFLAKKIYATVVTMWDVKTFMESSIAVIWIWILFKSSDNN